MTRKTTIETKVILTNKRLEKQSQIQKIKKLIFDNKSNQDEILKEMQVLREELIFFRNKNRELRRDLFELKNEGHDLIL